MSRAYDVLIFDLDGTLCDTAPDISRCLNRAMRDFDLPPVPHERVLRAIGPGGKAFYRAILPSEDYMPIAERVVERYRAYYTESNTLLTRPFPRVVEMLEDLRTLGVCMAVASNKPQEQTQQIVNALGLSPYFFEVFGPESVEHPKPAPDMLRLAMERASQLSGSPIRPERTLIVGDTDNDLDAGRAAGVTTAFAAWGYMPQSEINPDSVDWVIHSPAELVEIVERDENRLTQPVRGAHRKA